MSASDAIVICLLAYAALVCVVIFATKRKP